MTLILSYIPVVGIQEEIPPKGILS